MPLINTLGKQLTGQDIQTLKNLLRGSLENHIRRIEEGKSYAENNGETGLEFFDNIHAIYTEGLAQLETKINLALASQNTISVDGFINGMFSDMEKQAYEHLKTLPENDTRKDTFMGEVAMHFGGRDIQKFYGKEGEDWGIENQDLPEAFTNTTAPFKLATEPMEGVADIGTYDPNSMSVKLLYSGRSGNSTTLSRSVEELSQEREQILNDDKLNDRQKEERVGIIDRRIIETRNAVYGMNAGAEIARIHSSQMMAKKDPITFSDLYNAFSELNQALRPADPEGGTLRAHRVHAGAIMGVHGSFVPSTLIKTLDMIADGMNQVKATEDINLRKTRAIQLSSFAYTMMVSEHVFGDGNGRTCRLFADTILQTFGLPPYIPVNDKEIKIHTLGKSMDFNKAADVFLKGVKASDNILKPQIQAINEAKARQRKSQMSPKEAQFLLNEMTHMLTEDEEIRNEWKVLYDEKPEKADMTFNGNMIERNGKENFLDYANQFEKRSSRPFEEANKDHNSNYNPAKSSWAGHKANNIKDPLSLMVSFFELPQETRDRMPRLTEYMKKRAPLMEFLVNANTSTDFEAHTSLNTLMASSYNALSNGEFSHSVLFNSNDGVRNNPKGLNRCDMFKKIPDDQKDDSNGRYYLGIIEKSAGITNEATKELFLSEFEKAAAENNFRSEKVKGKLKASEEGIRTIVAEDTYRQVWDSMPKTKWWHSSPKAIAAITEVQEALEELDKVRNSLENDLSSGNREAMEEKLRSVIEASERYLNEKDAQKKISTDLKPEERLSHNNVRSEFGQKRYQAVYDIRKDCMERLERMKNANRIYNDLSSELEETLALEQKENEYFNELERNNDRIYKEIEKLTEERDILQEKYDSMDKIKAELQKDIEDYMRIRNYINQEKDTVCQNYVYKECSKNPEYSRGTVDIKNIDSAERSFRERAAKDKTVTPRQFNEHIKALEDQRNIVRSNMKLIVNDAMKLYESSGQKERNERRIYDKARNDYLAYHNDRARASARFDEIMEGKSQLRLEQFESQERFPVKKELNKLNSEINKLREQIKMPEDTAAMWKEHDLKFADKAKEHKIEAAKDVIKELQNKPSAGKNKVHHRENGVHNEHKKVNQM